MSEYESATGFLAPSVEELVPLFPNYQIHSLIATGGMGAVYHAVQISLDREVAIKILPAEFSSDASFCQSFESEAKAMARLNHPNLIGVFDFGEVAGMLFIVMEYVPGLSLHDVSGGAPVNPAEVIRVLKQISRGLSHAHDNGILHRDIKPANILLDQHAQPKIGDFGLARPVDLKVQEGEVIYGTPGYTAPEVLVPPHHADQRADIFSLGVMLHELLTGRLPEADPRPPSAICHCDPRLDAVVRKATHPRPEMRYQKASQIADDLDKIESGAGPRLISTAAAAPGRRAGARPAVKPRAYMPPPQKSNNGLLLLVLVLAVGLCAYLLRDKLAPGTVTEETKPGTGAKVVIPEPPKFGNQPAPPRPPRPPRPNPAPQLAEKNQKSDKPAAKLAEANEREKPEKPKEVQSPGLHEEAALADPAPTVPTVAKLNVSEFLKNAQRVMIRKSAFDISRCNDALKKNMVDFRREGKRLIRKHIAKDEQDRLDKEFDIFVTAQVQGGNRLGEKLPDEFSNQEGFPKFFETYQKNEARIDTALVSALNDELQTYILGLETRIKKLREENDPVAADEIQEEVDRVKGDPMTFVEMVVAGNP